MAPAETSEIASTFDANVQMYNIVGRAIVGNGEEAVIT